MFGLGKNWFRSLISETFQLHSVRVFLIKFCVVLSQNKAVLRNLNKWK